MGREIIRKASVRSDLSTVPTQNYDTASRVIQSNFDMVWQTLNDMRFRIDSLESRIKELENE